MSDHDHIQRFLRELAWKDLLIVLAILILARLLVVIVRWMIRYAAEKAPLRMRLRILRLAPIARLLIEVGSIAAILPILVELTFENVIALVASVALALAFAFKDYLSCLIAGVITILENTYQPGDWIELDGAYGEVTSIGLRAVHLVTADDTEVVIPHSRLWSASVFNASSGNRSLLCVTHFYLDPDHDGSSIRQCLTAIAESSPYRKPDTPITVIAMEKPWGTLYRLKVYAKESREQFLLITDLTIRGKKELREMNIRFAQAPYAEIDKS